MIRKINGSIKHYPWGGCDFLPRLLKQTNAQRDPWAEYWLGTHHLGMATVIDEGQSLLGFLQSKKYADIPFLLKVLDVREMLSIQVHPSKSLAEAGFARETAAGIALDAFNRTYKDDNHKPELMVALSEFWLVQGFQSTSEVVKVLRETEELSSLLPHVLHGGIQALFRHIMTTDQEEINNLLRPLGKRIKPLFENRKLKRSSVDYWAAKAFLAFNRKGFCDRGILLLYLMNLIQLQPGQGIFQAPGILHAYLEGQNIECMANSDNVIRGGLTQKLVDHQELLAVVNHRSSRPKIIDPTDQGDGLSNFLLPLNEFQVRIFRGGEVQIVNSQKPLLALCLDGSVECIQQNSSVRIERGEAVVIIGDFDLRSGAAQNCNIVMAHRP